MASVFEEKADGKRKGYHFRSNVQNRREWA
jgi:hypothetical protein